MLGRDSIHEKNTDDFHARNIVTKNSVGYRKISETKIHHIIFLKTESEYRFFAFL